MKRLAGKRWFYAQGQREQHMGLYAKPQGTLPAWALSAYSQGRTDASWGGLQLTRGYTLQATWEPATPEQILRDLNAMAYLSGIRYQPWMFQQDYSNEL
jgi:hypothetical protein